MAIELLGGYAGYEAGQQKRDYVHVEDVARLNCWFYDHPEVEGIYNVGTGKTRSFHEVATQVISHFGSPEGYIRHVPFPQQLKPIYQSYTCADITSLRRKGARLVFRDTEKGIPEFLEWLDEMQFNYQKQADKE
jgi:ADP-L-glycero-D-manno-heptose 6-epimerase